MKTIASRLNVRFIFPIGVSLLIIFTGCNQDSLKKSLIKKFASPEDEAIATNYIALLQQNKLERIENDLDASIKTADIHDTLAKMSAMIPPQDPVSVKVVGAWQNTNIKPDFHTINLTFEYQFPSKWLLINVATKKKDGVSTIIGFNVYPLSDSLENLNKFTLAGKNFLQYATLALAFLIPLLTLYALVLCILTKVEKRKWLWIIFILIGVGKLTVNWATGQWNFAPLSFQLFGAGSFAPPYGAWLISISLPLGAIMFLFQRKKLVASVEQVNPAS